MDVFFSTLKVAVASTRKCFQSKVKPTRLRCALRITSQTLPNMQLLLATVMFPCFCSCGLCLTLLHSRLEPHCCLWGGRGDDLSAVPCYAFAQRLDESMMAPFLRRAGGHLSAFAASARAAVAHAGVHGYHLTAVHWRGPLQVLVGGS